MEWCKQCQECGLANCEIDGILRLRHNAKASEKHYEDLSDLGASKVFDYRVANIVDCEGGKGRWSEGSDGI